jgi:hypothetical protein
MKLASSIVISDTKENEIRQTTKVSYHLTQKMSSLVVNLGRVKSTSR